MSTRRMRRFLWLAGRGNHGPREDPPALFVAPPAPLEGPEAVVTRAVLTPRLFSGQELVECLAQVAAADGLLAREALRPRHLVLRYVAQRLLGVARVVRLLLRFELTRVAVENDLSGQLALVFLDVFDFFDLHLDRS